MKTTRDKIHQKLIKVLEENNQILNLRPKIRKSTGSSDWGRLDTDEINDAVGLIVAYLNLSGGSNGNFDLYELLQSYFKDEDARKEINECVKSSLARLRKKNHL